MFNLNEIAIFGITKIEQAQLICDLVGDEEPYTEEDFSECDGTGKDLFYMLHGNSWHFWTNLPKPTNLEAIPYDEFVFKVQENN